MNIDTANAALEKMGYGGVVKQHFDPQTSQTMFDVAMPNGRQITMSADKLKDLIYSAAAGGDPSKRKRG